MSDGVMDDAPEIHILVNLVGLNVRAVRAYIGRSSHELRVVRSLRHDVCLILVAPTQAVALAQAEMFWGQKIPARLCVDVEEETAFVAALTLGREDHDE